MFAKNYITECEEKHGIDAVEKLLDSCHALMNFGVDRYKRPQKISLAEEKRRQKAREDYLQTQVNELWRTLPKQHKIAGVEDRRYPAAVSYTHLDVYKRQSEISDLVLSLA